MPEIPEGAKRPSDHAAKAEATGATIVVEFGGLTYEIDRDNADNLELMEFIEEGQYIKATKGYIGADQWAKFKDAHRDEKGRVRSADFEPFLQAVMTAIGGGSGN